MNTELVKTDLDNIKPSLPNVRLDDKAATLEQDLASLKARFNQERVVYLYIINLVFLLFLSEGSSRLTFCVAAVGSVIVQIALGKWLGFPWMHRHLDGWHNLLIKTYRLYVLREKLQDIEESEPME